MAKPLSLRYRSAALLVGEPLAKDLFFHVFACGSKTSYCRKAKRYVSRAKRSEAPRLENATECQGLPY